MTREQTVDLIRSLVSIYPNWKPENLTDTVNAWQWALEEYPAPAVKAALQTFIKTSNTGFAPSVAELIGCMQKLEGDKYPSEGEAWAMVKKAIQDGNYHAEEQFNELPPLVQKAVGGVNMIRQWAMTDSDEVNTIIMSNFQRTYRILVKRQEFDDRVPIEVKETVKRITG